MFNKITLGPITIYMYGLMIAIGFASALFLCNYRGKKRGLSEDTIFGIFLCALIGGMVGCRLLYYIVELPAIMEDPSILWDFKNGYVVYGGIIGGIVTSYVYCRIKKENFICLQFPWHRDLGVLDVFVPVAAMEERRMRGMALPLRILILHQTV